MSSGNVVQIDPASSSSSLLLASLLLSVILLSQQLDDVVVFALEELYDDIILHLANLSE